MLFDKTILQKHLLNNYSSKTNKKTLGENFKFHSKCLVDNICFN